MMKIPISDLIDQVLPSEKEVVRIRDAESEGMFLNLLDMLCRVNDEMASKFRITCDVSRSSYHKGQADAYRAAYRHYMEMRGP